MNWQIEWYLRLACQHNNRDFTCGLRLILGEIMMLILLTSPASLAIFVPLFER
jgi:hypothetical protein